MAKRERVLEELLIGPASDGRDGNEYLVSTLRYEMGGMNYFSGIKGLVLDAKAFSDKKLAALTVSPEYVAKLKRHVLGEMIEKARQSIKGQPTPEKEARLGRLQALLMDLIPVEEEVK